MLGAKAAWQQHFEISFHDCPVRCRYDAHLNKTRRGLKTNAQGMLFTSQCKKGKVFPNQFKCLGVTHQCVTDFKIWYLLQKSLDSSKLRSLKFISFFFHTAWTRLKIRQTAQPKNKTSTTTSNFCQIYQRSSKEVLAKKWIAWRLWFKVFFLFFLSNLLRSPLRSAWFNYNYHYLFPKCISRLYFFAGKSLLENFLKHEFT